MISVESKEAIRRAHVIEGKSLRQIERESGHSRRTIQKALGKAEVERYKQDVERAAPVLGPYKARIEALLEENQRLPVKQRYTAHKMYEVVYAAGYRGSESGVHVYVWQRRSETKRPAVFLPLAYQPGADAQADWGEALVELQGERITVQYLEIRLCYSRKLFVRAYPTQRQEAFFDGQVAAFKYFGGVPHQVWYDNLTSAVQKVLHGRARREQRQFVAFRSHYLFDAEFCTPGQGHEKGGVENGIGYARRNLFVPLIQARSWDDLNAQLMARCTADDARTVRGQSQTIAQLFDHERAALLPLPDQHPACCVSHEVTLNGYSQVTFETNRYSVPVELARKHLTLRAYPFQVDIVEGDRILATHPRSYAREQEVFDPLHYLTLLERSPRALNHAKPVKFLAGTWPKVWSEALNTVQTNGNDGHSVREFVNTLRLLNEYPPVQVEAALVQTLALVPGRLSADAVRLHLHLLQTQRDPATQIPHALNWHAHPELAHAEQFEQLKHMGAHPIHLDQYDQLLTCIPVTVSAESTLAVEGGNHVAG